MAENKNENGTGKVEDVELSDAWLNDDEDVEEEEETVYGGNDSNFIVGYGVHTAKIVMAKRILVPKKKVEFIEIDFVTKEGKTHRESFMVRGKDGKSFYTYQKRKKQHFGVSKIKSLIKVLGLYDGETNLMKALYSNTEEQEVTFEEYGKEITADYTVFTDLIDAKVKLCISSKKENSTTAAEQDDSDEQAYVDQCIKDTEKYKKANPKKKSLKKFGKDDDYVNVYRWFTVSEIKHFCSMGGKFGSEMDDEEGVMLQQFIDGNDEGEVFEGRTLIADDLSERALKKLGINEFGKRVDADEDDDGYDDEEDDVNDDEVEDDEEEVEAPKKSKAKAKPAEDEDEDADW